MSDPVVITIDAYTHDGVGCSYTDSLSFSPDLNTLDWVSVSDRTITIDTADSTLHATSQVITVTSTLDDDSALTNSDRSITVNFNYCLKAVKNAFT